MRWLEGDFDFPFSVALNSLLCITSVNVTGSELTFSSALAQIIFQPWPDEGTVDSTSTLAVFDL